MLCSKLHCQKGSNPILFSYQIRNIGRMVAGVVEVLLPALLAALNPEP